MNLKNTIRKVLNEWYITIDREKQLGMPYDDIESILNRLMSKKYDWWKNIKFEDILYSEISNKIELYGTLTVDKEWGKMMWNKERGYSKFPGNNGWDEKSKHRIVRMDDIVSGEIERDISKSLTTIIGGTTNYIEAKSTIIGILKLKFV